MYGFIEKWLADILEIPHEDFGLNDGSRAALLDKPVFERVIQALRILWKEDHDPEILMPISINSDIAGAKLLFHKYWSNEDILNVLTDGPTKNSNQMIAFIELGNPRFDYN